MLTIFILQYFESSKSYWWKSKSSLHPSAYNLQIHFSGRQSFSWILNKVSRFEIIIIIIIIIMGADKSLARPRRKQATETKLGIYSTYPLRSSIFFLDRCSNLWKPLKKFRKLSVQPVFRGSNDLRVGRKMAKFQFLFSVQGTGPMGSDPENRVGEQDTGGPGRPVSSGLQVPVESGILSCKNKIRLVNFPRRFSFKISFNCTSRDE